MSARYVLVAAFSIFFRVLFVFNLTLFIRGHERAMKWLEFCPISYTYIPVSVDAGTDWGFFWFGIAIWLCFNLAVIFGGLFSKGNQDRS